MLPGLSIFKYQPFPFSPPPACDLAFLCFPPQECPCWELAGLSPDGNEGEASRASEPEEFQDLLRLHFLRKQFTLSSYALMAPYTLRWKVQLKPTVTLALAATLHISQMKASA